MAQRTTGAPASGASHQSPTVALNNLAGSRATSRIGPDLTHLMSRATIGAGAAPNTRESLLAWVRNPDGQKHGVLMPAMQIDEKYLHQLVEYLITLR